MWNKTISLPIEQKTITDAEGFPKESFALLRNIPARFEDVTRNDELLALNKGYTVSLNVEIMEINYSGQSWLIDERTGIVYDIKRTFKMAGRLILSCERRESNGI